MRRSLEEIEKHAAHALLAMGHGQIAKRVAKDCAWLEACSYPGLSLLLEAFGDTQTSCSLVPDALGLDLQNVSCIFLADDVERIRVERGRIFLRNVRHGLYLVPGSVNGNYGIGCPVDPGFALGGERTKNPYVEKLDIAQRDGIEVDDALWQSLTQGGA
jgi:hypothetical protein